MVHSDRLWWVAAGLVAVAVLVLLAAIATRGSPGEPASYLAPGESEALHARVVDVLEEATVAQGEFEQPYQRLMLRITTGALAGQQVEVEQGLLGLTNQARTFRAGDRVLVEHTSTLDGAEIFYITDYVRTGPLVWLTALFVAATLLLSGWQGARSLAGMGVSLVVIVGFIVPQILSGRNPVAIAVLGSVVMMGTGLYLVYGWAHKTHVAVAGLFLSLLLTGFLATWFVGWARLSGFGAEEAGFLQVAGVQLDLQGLLLAGIIVGTLGALDDVAIGQSSAIFELHKANPRLGRRALFRHGMVYTEPWGMTLNREIIAEEIVRTLVGSLGLLAGVPLTSLIAALVARRAPPGPDRAGPGSSPDSIVNSD
jgi:uncharacterized membrane protein